jgi:integrase
MRPGEVYALKWDCVDLAGERIIVKSGISDGVLTESTKTKSQRIVPIHPDLAYALREHRKQMMKEQRPGFDLSLVFPSSRGTVRLPQSLSKVHTLACEAAHIDVRVGPQVLRRTFNTLLVRAGVDRITLRSMMGHSSERMTERYAGINLADKQAAVISIFSGKKGS